MFDCPLCEYQILAHRSQKLCDGCVRNKIIPAPQWLVDQMTALRNAPKPTLEEVKRQMKASAEFRKNHL